MEFSLRCHRRTIFEFSKEPFRYFQENMNIALFLQQQLNTSCDEETAAVLNDSYMLEEKERLKEELRVFEEQRKNFEIERRNFTEAAVRLGHEVLAYPWFLQVSESILILIKFFSFQRKCFEDDRAMWLKHQFLNTTFADQMKPQSRRTDEFSKRKFILFTSLISLSNKTWNLFSDFADSGHEEKLISISGKVSKSHL